MIFYIFCLILHLFKELAKKAKMTCAELDLYMWYMKAGEVLK